MSNPSPSDPNSPFTALTAEEELRLWPLAVHARHLLRELRYVDYGQAEQDAALLAHKLLTHYQASELRRTAFIGLPRGGLIVLGLLAYQLDLQARQFTADFAETADLLCLVDDCALSGLRLQQALSALGSRRVVVAHLYSAPGLRSAVRKRYPNVEQCLAAHDLAGKPLARDVAAQEEELDVFLDGRLYPASSQSVAFAWNEPNLLVLTPFDDQPIHQWRFLPPHKCLKNRQLLGLPPGPPYKPEWLVPDGLVYGWFDGTLYLLDTRREQVFRLDGLAADCWRAAAGYGAADTALAFLHQAHETIDSEDIQRQLEANLQFFQAQQLLDASPDPV